MGDKVLFYDSRVWVGATKAPQDDDTTGAAKAASSGSASRVSIPTPSGAVARANPSGAGRPPEPVPADDEELPRELSPKYRLDRLVAIGGMGRVYAATQLPLNRTVAVKLLATQKTNDDFRRRFFLEASISARLQHRNIVTVHDYGEGNDGSLFMVMELLDGDPLTSVLARETRVEPERAGRIAIEICRALRAAHREGVAHRDLKPGNVMLLRGEEEGERERVKVLDFGLVKVFQETEDAPLERDLTRGETMLGSPRYMAPEQIVCEPADNRADIYSLGVLLFSLVAGATPFSGRSTVQVLQAHLHAPVPAIHERVVLRPGETGPVRYPAGLDDVIRRCMEKRPEDRYQSVDEVIAAITSVFDGRGAASGEVSVLRAEGSSTGRSGAFSVSLTPTPGPSPTELSPNELAPGQLAPGQLAPGQLAPGQLAPGQLGRARSRARSGAIAAVVLGAVTLGASVAFLTGGAEPAAPAVATPPPAPAEPAPTRVLISSEPAGAEVRLGDRSLGRTPLEHTLAEDAAASGELVVFDLSLEGHRPARVPAVIRGESVSVHAELQRLPEERPSAPPIVAPPVDPAPAASGRARRRETETPPAAAMPTGGTRSSDTEDAPRRSTIVDEGVGRRSIPIVD